MASVDVKTLSSKLEESCFYLNHLLSNLKKKEMHELTEKESELAKELLEKCDKLIAVIVKTYPHAE